MTALRLGSLFDGIGVFPLAAVRCGIEDASGFAERFIYYERQVRADGRQNSDVQ